MGSATMDVLAGASTPDISGPTDPSASYPPTPEAEVNGVSAATQPPQNHLFRGILAGALAGMGVASQLRGGQANFAGGLGAGVIGANQQRQQNIENQERQTASNQKQQQIDIEQQNAENERQLRNAQLANIHVETLIADRKLAALPEDRQAAMMDDLRSSVVAPLLKSGAEFTPVHGDYAAAQQAALEKTKSGSFEYFAVPDPTQDGKYGLMKVAEKPIQSDTTIALKDPVTGKDTSFTVKAGSMTQTDVAKLKFDAWKAGVDVEGKIAAARAASERATTQTALRDIDADISNLSRLKVTTANASAADLTKQSFWQQQGLTPPPAGVSDRKGIDAWIDTQLVQKQNERAKLMGIAPPAATPAAAVGEPSRPANVPANYVFKSDGPQGRGWYKP